MIVKFEKGYIAERYKNELLRSVCYDSNNAAIICDAEALREIGIRKPWFRRQV